MKNLVGCLLVIMFMSCSKKETNENLPTPVLPDFEMTLTGNSPTATVKLINKTLGATAYKWSFGMGSNVTTSTNVNPADILVDKAGIFTVSLEASNQAGSKTITKDISIGGYSALLEYNNLKFGDRNIGTEPYVFSTSLGSFYRLNEINSTNGSKIDLVYYKNGCCSFQHFQSPDSTHYTPVAIPGARKTIVMNYNGNTIINAAQFDALRNDSLLKTVNIYYDNSVLLSGFGYPHFIYFINADNKRGVIRLKSYANDYSHVVGDIKVQKY
jgi:PKD repeat protein